jgi:hypothetical protein
MKRSGAVAVLALVLVLSVPSTLTARANANTKFAIHFVAHPGGCSSDQLPVINSQHQLVTRWNALRDVDAFFVIFDWDSLLNYEYGLSWPAEWGSCSTSICAKDLSVGTIVHPGDGLVAGFTTCQWSAAHGGSRPAFWPTVVHWFTATSPGLIVITRDPATCCMGLTGCRPLENPEYAVPESVFYGRIEMNPVEPTTWGSIKAQFKE